MSQTTQGAATLARRRVPTDALAALLATLAAGAVYVGLQGELPYHDAARFTAQVADGVPVWDVAHVLLQPTALLLAQLSGGDPERTLKALSSGATAIAIGLFLRLLLRLAVPIWPAICGAALLATSCAVVTLAPSAHPKLVAFPFLVTSFARLCEVERTGRVRMPDLMASAVLLALAGGYLVSAIATLPFATLAVLATARRGGCGWEPAIRRALVFGTIGATVFALILLGSFAAIAHQPPTTAGLLAAVGHKAELRPFAVPLAVRLGLALFGSANELIALSTLGAVGQAWMRGQIGTLAPYHDLLPWLGLALVIGLLLAWIYVSAARAAWRGRRCLVPLAFLAGAQAWSAWYGLNDPEHWFQLAPPTIVLFLTVLPLRAVRRVLPVWLAVAVTVNVGLLAWPVAAYPLRAQQAALARLLGPDDLLVFFAAYPGRPYAGFLAPPPARSVPLDRWLMAPQADPKAVFAALDVRIDATLRAGGHVLVADMLDADDWDAPWMALLARGVTKPALYHALLAGRRAVPRANLAGIRFWNLEPAR